MTVRRTVLPLVCLTSLMLLSARPGQLSAAGDAVSVSSAPAGSALALKESVQGLESPAFAVREASSERLENAQAPALPLLLWVAKEGTLEASVRAVRILEAIYVSADQRGDGAAVDGAESALEELERSGRPSVSDRADTVLESRYDIRERRAVAEVERFHGVPKFGQPGEMANAWAQRFNPVPPAADRAGDASKDKGELTWLIIGPKWTGGDEGLRQVARLKRLRFLYRIQGCPVSDGAIARLRLAIPGLEVQVRGAAKLGITHSGSPGEKGCMILEVQEGEAAANAGLRPQDRIVRFGDRDVDDFDVLVDLLRSYKPGDVVDTFILREDVPMTVPITLTGWD